MATSWLEIDSFALIQNVRIIRKVVGEMPLWAVVKANAYGHGLLLASEAFWRGGVDGLVVANAEEAKILSEQRYKLPILVLLTVPEDMLTYASANGWHVAITSLDYFRLLEHFVMVRQKPLHIQLELETGMHHTGLPASEIEAILTKCQRPESKITVTGLFTRLVTPTDQVISQNQLKMVQEVRFALQRRNLALPMTHVLDSKGLGIYGQDYIFDAVRIGSALYGLSTYFGEAAPALRWKTKVMMVSQTKPGESVGMDATWQSRFSTRTAVLPVGFADGLDSRLSNGGKVLIGGKFCTILGKVDSNRIVVDTSGLFKVTVGEEVVLIGDQKGNRITVATMAKWAGVSEQEAITGINADLPRVKTK